MLTHTHTHTHSQYGYTSALMSIPYSSRLLHIHSFTSLIWNHTASFRIKQYGMEPVEGDLVLRDVQPQSTAKPTWKCVCDYIPNFVAVRNWGWINFEAEFNKSEASSLVVLKAN